MITHRGRSDECPLFIFWEMKIFVLSLLLWGVHLLPAQIIYERPLYDMVWLFNESQIDFNFIPPDIIAEERAMPLEGTNASMCDENGELLAYTNGIYISDAYGNTIQNGEGINPGEFAESVSNRGFPFPQFAIFLKTQLGNNIFLFHENLIHLEAENHYGDFFYAFNLSQTILSDEDDLPFILTKNDTLLIDTLGIGQLTATRCGDGSSWWILVNKNYTNQYHKLLLKGDTVLNMGITAVGDTIRTGVGAAKFSPDGRKFAKLDLVDWDNQTISLYDFDRCSGELSNPVHIRDTGFTLVGGLAFSENSRFLYVPYFSYLYQFDLEAEDIEASRVLISPSINGWAYYMAQLAPNSKIYISHQGTQDSIHIIHHPNRRGHACDFVHLGQPLPDITFRTMPNFPYYGLGPWDGSPCDTLGIDNPPPTAAFEHTQDTSVLSVEFFDASHYATSWQWDFGDGSPSSDAHHPVHTYPQDGVYEVCLTVANISGVNTHCETLYVGTVSTQETFAPAAELAVWPNPAEDVLHLRLRSLSGFVNVSPESFVTISDVHGRIVRQIAWPRASEVLMVDVSALPSGLYFYELHDEGRLLASGKVVKM
ncbi:MAG: PKD domain-containing protein [Saprospiraceae bacterium]